MAVVRAKALKSLQLEDALRHLPAIEAGRIADTGDAHLAARGAGPVGIPSTIADLPSPSGFPAALSLASLDGANGFRLDGNGAGAQVLIAALTGGPALTAADFVVI